tara:strand:- start:8 stop:196 length:189 start_codon:yes stop_codon:yes gene_type:complete
MVLKESIKKEALKKASLGSLQNLNFASNWFPFDQIYVMNFKIIEMDMVLVVVIVAVGLLPFL